MVVIELGVGKRYYRHKNVFKYTKAASGRDEHDRFGFCKEKYVEIRVWCEDSERNRTGHLRSFTQLYYVK